ncbi:MAG: UDP-4-amino-4,6-dideoxy-N-acetyl-beta-L-altrosamine N-acetyltransferase [Dissulfuribacterales bacterium]
MERVKPFYYDCKLRFVVPDSEDCDLLLKWRNSDRVRMNMLNDQLISRDEHLSWLNYILQSSKNKVWIFEYKCVPMGQFNIKEINNKNRTARLGFYIGEENAPTGLGSAMLYLGFERIFERENIRKLCSDILSTNKISLHINKKFGFQEEGCLKQQIFRNGEYIDLVLMALFQSDWLANKDRLRDLIFEKELSID